MPIFRVEFNFTSFVISLDSLFRMSDVDAKTNAETG